MRQTTPVGNLPPERTSFVGRQRELAEVKRLLGIFPLVTVTGLGGVGKTRVALRAARELGGEFTDGVWLAELSPLHEPDLLAHLVAEALAVLDQTSRPMDEVLVDFLADKDLLLVLDTCEHLADACAQLVSRLIASAPRLRVLATSRQQLGIVGEWQLEILPLPVPADPQDPEGATQKAQGNDTQGEEALVLFADRAAAVLPRFAVNPHNRSVVARVCRRLEGIPLAIELAAVRLRDACPADDDDGRYVDALLWLAERLDDRLGLLIHDHGRDEVALRHQALRTTIGWSHQLCTPGERLLWTRLSVFSGGFDLASATAVCADEQLPAYTIVVLAEHLVIRSLLQREGIGLQARYRMLDTVCDYGLGWLRELGEQEALRTRHRDCYRWLARRGSMEWIGPDQVRWYECMVTEHANLRAALDFSLADPEGHTALEMVGDLWFFWLACGFLSEGRYYMERVLALDPVPSPVRTRVLWACGMAAAGQGDTAAAENLSAECIAAAEEQSDTESALAAYQLLGSTMSARGEQARAATALDKAAELYRSLDEPGPAGFVTLIARPYLCVMQGDFTRALSLIEELWAECDKRGEKWLRSFGDYQRGIVDLAHGEIDSAVVHGRAALEVKASLHDRLGTVLATDLLASAAAARGDGKRTARLLGFGQQLWQTFSLPQMGSPELAAMREAGERQARETIGDVAYERAFTTGLRLSQEQGIRYALDEIGEQDVI